jgi:hypothetical protein
MVDFKNSAEDCRRLAKLIGGSDHWAAFLEMAETWEKLADLHELAFARRHRLERTYINQVS